MDDKSNLEKESQAAGDGFRERSVVYTVNVYFGTGFNNYYGSVS